MFPFSFEWIWDMSHMVFHGGLWYALSIMGLGVTYCIIKAAYDTAKARAVTTSTATTDPLRKTDCLALFSPLRAERALFLFA